MRPVTMGLLGVFAALMGPYEPTHDGTRRSSEPFRGTLSRRKRKLLKQLKAADHRRRRERSR